MSQRHGLALALLALALLTSCATSPQHTPPPGTERSAASESKTYHRFWRGYRRADVSEKDFVQILNSRFVPATVTAGAGKGLLAYLPVLLPPLKVAGPQGTAPDEVALVSYQSLDAYQAIRQTPEGKAYGDMHWELFARDRSGSLAPEPFKDRVSIGAAYDLHPAFTDWQHGYTVCRLRARAPNVSDERYARDVASDLAEIQKNPALRGATALVDAQYVLEIQSWASADQVWQAKEPSSLQKAVEVTLQRIAPESVALKPGQGANVAF